MFDLSLSPADLRDQRDRLEERFDTDRENIDTLWEDVRLHVNLLSQDAGLSWSDETKDAVTNVVLAMEQQLHIQQHAQTTSVRRRLVRDIVLHVALIIVSYGAITGLLEGEPFWVVFTSIVAALALFVISVFSRYTDQ